MQLTSLSSISNFVILKALEMSPDRHFLFNRLCITVASVGNDENETLPLVYKVLRIDPEHGYAITVRDRILSQ